MSMKYQSLKLTDREVLEIFPESKKIIPQKLKEWEKVLKREEDRLKDCLLFIYGQNLDEFSTWFLEQIAKLYLMPSILESNKHVLRLKRMLSIASPDGKNLERWQEKVGIARQYPIETLARSKLEMKQSGRNFTSLCPFHNERRPSFYIYPETNTYHCFGCQENGDVIRLATCLYGISFREAIQMLQ